MVGGYRLPAVTTAVAKDAYIVSYSSSVGKTSLACPVTTVVSRLIPSRGAILDMTTSDISADGPRGFQITEMI